MCNETLKEIIQMISEFSDEYLNEEYKDLCVKLAKKLADTKDFSFNKDKPEIWACGIIYVICQLNFTFEGLYDPYVSRNMVCGYFSATRVKINNKSRDIRRLLNLKLGNKDFSNEFILSLNIEDNDVDLKRIRIFDEVKFQISQRPDDINSLDNSKLLELLNKARHAENKQDYLKEIFLLLRSAFFVRAYSWNMELTLGMEEGSFFIPLFTSKEECDIIKNKVDAFNTTLWPFINILDYMGNKNFAGIVINPDINHQGFLLTNDMIEHVYPHPNKYNYYNIFFAHKPHK